MKVYYMLLQYALHSYMTVWSIKCHFTHKPNPIFSKLNKTALLLHIAMLCNCFRWEKNRTLYLELLEYLGSQNLIITYNFIYKSKMHIWLIFFSIIQHAFLEAFSLLSLFDLKNIFAESSDEISNEQKTFISLHQPARPATKRHSNIVSPYESLIWDCNYSKIFLIFFSKKVLLLEKVAL